MSNLTKATSNVPASQRVDRINTLRQFLLLRAKAKQTTTYHEVRQLIATKSMSEFFKILKDCEKLDFEAGRPILATLINSYKKTRPDSGYFTNVKIALFKDSRSNEEFYQEQLARCFDEKQLLTSQELLTQTSKEVK
jgi:hypothetical protein